MSQDDAVLKKVRINEHKKKNKIAIVPLDDSVPHDDFNEQCWCNPALEADGHILVHNSFDGREDFENIKEET